MLFCYTTGKYCLPGRKRTCTLFLMRELLHRLSYGQLAGVTGIEPVTFCLTDRRFHQLSYTPLLAHPNPSQEPLRYQRSALPVVLCANKKPGFNRVPACIYNNLPPNYRNSVSDAFASCTLSIPIFLFQLIVL